MGTGSVAARKAVEAHARRSAIAALLVAVAIGACAPAEITLVQAQAGAGGASGSAGSGGAGAGNGGAGAGNGGAGNGGAGAGNGGAGAGSGGAGAGSGGAGNGGAGAGNGGAGAGNGGAGNGGAGAGNGGAGAGNGGAGAGSGGCSGTLCSDATTCCLPGTACTAASTCATVTPASCTANDVTCSADGSALVTCTAQGDGTWTEACPAATPTCDKGKCVTCVVKDDGNECTYDVCKGTTLKHDFKPAGSPCGGFKQCDGNGSCVGRPSCANPKTTNCGASLSCCAMGKVGDGQPFAQDWYTGDVVHDDNHIARVSPFYMDKFEVTVSRFRLFVADYDNWLAAGHPKAGEGGDPTLTNLATGLPAAAGAGWDPAWNTWGPTGDLKRVPPDSKTLRDAMNFSWGGGFIDVVGSTDAGSSEYYPAFGITWYAAFMFCIWDGGRLPTSAEWNWVASNGKDQLPYPWSTSGTDTTATATDASWALTELAFVGKAGKDVSKTGGIFDLTGNAREWLRDQFAPSYSTIGPCLDCVDLTDGPERAYRGGGIYTQKDSTNCVGDFCMGRISYNLTKAGPSPAPPDTPTKATETGGDIGFRCARREPPPP